MRGPRGSREGLYCGKYVFRCSSLNAFFRLSDGPFRLLCIMAKKFFFGLTGRKLRTAQMWTVILPAYILFGYNQAAMGGLLGLDTFIATFPRINTETTTGAVQAENARIQGTVVALYTLGCFFGALSCIQLGDRLGRIRMIELGAFVHIIGAVLQASSYSLGQLIVGRLVRVVSPHLRHVHTHVD